MANVLAELFQNTANAIREKTGGEGTMKPFEFPEKIRNITVTEEAVLEELTVTENGKYYPTGSLAADKTYTFKKSYTQEELKALFQMSSSSHVNGSMTTATLFYSVGSSVSVDTDGVNYTMTAVVDEGWFLYVPDMVDPDLGELHEGWLIFDEKTNSYVYTDQVPMVYLAQGLTSYVGDIAELSPLFDIPSVDGFSSVNVNVQAVPDLEELTVRENGVYEPNGADGFSKVTVAVPETVPVLEELTVEENGVYEPQAELAFGNTYAFRDDYTQETLKALYDLAPERSADGMYAFLMSTSEATIGIMYTSSAYGVYISTGYIWIPPAFASLLGYEAGWHFGTDVSDLILAPIPEVDFVQDETAVYTETLSELNPLFDIPAADGFSKVAVSVPVAAEPVLKPLSVTENGTYRPQNADGFSEVTVHVEGSAVEGTEAHMLTFIGADGSTLYTKPTIDGDTSYDPVIQGKIEEPRKSSTDQFIYTYSGWSETNNGSANSAVLAEVKEDRTLYAVFTQTDRLYTVRFFDGESILKEEEVAYGSIIEPPPVPSKDGYSFKSWSSNDFTVYADKDYYAIWEELSGWIIRDTDPNFVMDTISAAAYSPTDKRLAIYERGSKEKITVYDTTSYPYTKKFTRSADSSSTPGVQTLDFSDDGKYLIYGSNKSYGVLDTTVSPYQDVQIYATATGDKTNPVRNAKFIHGTTDVIWGYGKATEIMKRCTYKLDSTGIVYRSVAFPNMNGYGVSINRSGTKIAFADGNTFDTKDGISVHNAATGERESACPTERTNIYSCTFDYSGRYLLFEDGSVIRCFDTSTNPYTEITFADIANVNQTIYASTRLIASKGKEYLFFRNADGKLVLYDMRSVPFRYIEDFPEVTSAFDEITVSGDLKEIMISAQASSQPIFIKNL
ncbi:MAG: InlB B-repeat-containing protein [Clostridia bacterium]|nr:InlB B-repeat-containing protein [Clostridia bacterium]